MERGEERLSARSSGVLLHPTSLPSGRIDGDAYAFVDWLAAAGQRWWQILPLGPPDAFGSPYTSMSAFAAWPRLLAAPEARVTRSELRAFRRRQAYWIGDWERYCGDAAAVDQVRFEREWSELRRYAAARGIRLIGDVPIYVARESADYECHRELFEAGAVAGAAPDAAHPDGQLWGQPLYDWRAMRRDCYRWWIERFRRTFEFVDVARVDHFRGFVSYWAVPEGAASPLEGSWRRGPGAALFRAVEAELGPVPLIAEDLGLITPAVDRLRRELGMLGMRILVRGFVRRHRRRHAVAAHPEDAVVYTGTHDHSTIRGWLETASAAELARAAADAAAASIVDRDPVWTLVLLALASRARIAILPMQDVLTLGDEARMNVPGTFGARNWQWRLEPGQLTPELAARLREACFRAGRVAHLHAREERRALAAAAS